MTIYYDVSIALKKEIYEGLSEELKAFVEEGFEAFEAFDHEEGYLFYAKEIQWDLRHDNPKELYEELFLLEVGDYQILAASYEDASDTHMDMGAWWDNPWGATKVVSAEITFGFSN